jgi:adenosyl cobinamide kinase/adenosyl cobinamide phosphate guanylyltransferase
MTSRPTLVLGGSRSGKSAVAERLAADAADAGGGAVVRYLATGPDAGDDGDWDERVRRHRERRPVTWETVECGPELVPALADAADAVVLVDALGTWVAGHRHFDVDVGALVAALTARTAPTIVVSEEVGLGVHPETAVGRRFRDVLGEVNTAVAAVCDEVLLVVAGRVLRLPAAPA